jgi:selenide, water dikinase
LNPSTFIAKELVLLGGGHSHVIVLRMLAMQPIAGLQITLISPDVETPYSGMLPGLVAGHYGSADMHIDLVPLCRFADARFVQASAFDIDPIRRLVRCHGRPDIGYDVLSIDIGITPAVAEVPGAAAHVIAVKPINRFLHQWRACLARIADGSVGKLGFVGGGAGGVELCLAVHHYLTKVAPELAPKPIAFHLFVDHDSLLSEFNPSVQALFSQKLATGGIQLHRNFRVVEVEKKTLVSMAGERFTLDEIFWVTSAAAQSWLADTQLATDKNGFVAVRDTLQVNNFDDVFAVGDTAHVLAHPRPKAGVFAVRQGPVLYENIRRQLLGQKLKHFVPQTSFLSLISTGDKAAVAMKYGRHIHGRWVWRLKDWIDRRFMAQFTVLPPMQQKPGAGLLTNVDLQMQCGGCGSKVSADLLAEVLSHLDIHTKELDDAAIYRAPAGKLMLHTVDVFKAFVEDPYLLAKIAVNHAVSDIYAMGGEPVTAMAIVTTPYGTPTATRHLLQQLMQGAWEELVSSQVKLVGGHTTEAAELSVGFAVNGIVDEARLLRKSGMQPGQVLILTKPIGTGTLFAADMQHRARGQWIEGALQMMLQSNAAAGEIFSSLSEKGSTCASACTDITGFGLAGHLSEMMQASDVNVSLDLLSLPLLAGSLACLQDLQITSSLHAGNQRSVSNIQSCDHPNYGLLFDPQTSGGLLAAVDADLALDTLSKLYAAGYAQATVIGRVESFVNTSGESIQPYLSVRVQGDQ